MEKKVKVAFCYDFDGTLSPGNTMEYSFMEKLGLEPEAFWKKVNLMAAFHNADSNLCYMQMMIEEARKQNMPFRREDLMADAAGVVLFEGVESWFSRINAYAASLGIEIQHFIISSGLQEILEGLSISSEFTRIYANSYIYDADGEAIWPGRVVNYTGKTQYLYRISKGCLEENDLSINLRTRPEELDIPFRNMLYIGDGFTDVPCMATLSMFGGQAVAVYRPGYEKGMKTARKLFAEKRVSFCAPADYRDGSRLDGYAKALLEKIYADSRLARL